MLPDLNCLSMYCYFKPEFNINKPKQNKIILNVQICGLFIITFI
jgi:hypothetical protein